MHKHRHVHQFVRINVRKKKGFLSSDCQIREFKIVISSNNLFFRTTHPVGPKGFRPTSRATAQKFDDFFFFKKGSPSTLSDLAVAGGFSCASPSPLSPSTLPIAIFLSDPCFGYAFHRVALILRISLGRISLGILSRKSRSLIWISSQFTSISSIDSFGVLGLSFYWKCLICLVFLSVLVFVDVQRWLFCTLQHPF